MFTLFYSVGHVVGAEITLLVFFAFTLLYYILCTLVADKQHTKIFHGWLVCEVICDLLWWLIYFSGGDYYNHGIGGAYLILLWPVLLGIAAAILCLSKK